jgi:hypothetical protein
MPLFHVSSSSWNSGDLIESGSWGRTLRQFRPGGPDPASWEVLMWEIALETARLQVAPVAPSRFNCVFVCESEAFAIRFRNLYRPDSCLVQVEPTDDDQTIHRGDFMLISENTPDQPAYVDYMTERGISYWTSNPAPGMAEILFDGPVRVV